MDATTQFAPATRAFGCPVCDDARPLEVLRRYERVGLAELRYCPRCYGFWAARDALSSGVVDEREEHPALRATVSPPRCKLCFGYIKPDGACAKCGAPPRTLSCPACARPMERNLRGKTWIDACPGCGGCWFDTGELSLVYGLTPPQSLAMRTIDEHATKDDEPLWLQAIFILARVFLPLP
jgi:Zn-finger nucleic acid-binding protein